MALLDRYVARVCWNTHNWVRPSGDAAQAESDTYAARMGFGHEEWLFNFAWLVDGWKYAFLQPVGKSLSKLEGKAIDVRLYSLSDTGWFYVGHLRACEVLTGDLANAARIEFKKRGWLAEMVEQVRQVGGDVQGLNPDQAAGIFNIRFRPSHAELYDPMVVVGAKDAIRNLRRYTLVELSGDQSVVDKEWASRVGSPDLRRVGKHQRAAIASREVDLVHNGLQNELYGLLLKTFGKGAVEMEDGFVDIKLRREGKVTLIEVKSDSRPRYAIREAIGQLLEYAYAAERKGEVVRDLIVAGPGELQALDLEYLEYLQDARGLPVRYLCIRNGSATLDL